MRKWRPIVVVCLLGLLLGRTVRAADDDAPVKAPDFTGADGWLNTEKPISIASLKGQVVVLDFWTYCCINCMHIFPDLKFLEEKYAGQPVVVIGIHSGKFDQEKDADHIRQAVLRHNIAHPVAVDSDYKIWNAYDVNAWPTQVVIDSEGNVAHAWSGEGHRNDMDRMIAQLLASGKSKGTLGKHLEFKTERSKFKSGALEFPGKVLADGTGKRLFISDTNHHRVLVTDLTGRVSATIGTGAVGLKDGTFADAQFYQPQGLALTPDGKTLYVADTENHAVRTVDLEKKTVGTLAGTGHQTRDRRVTGDGPKTALSSPWDLALVGGKLYVAMAGTHQIWAIDTASSLVSVFAGTGKEAAVEGPLLRSAFAQPSGVATDGKTLWVASSEASSIQSVGLSDSGLVRTVAGSANLFGFGLTDGVGDVVRFQHPLGLSLAEGTLYIADTFNNVIRKLDVNTGQVSRVAGTGKADLGTPEAIGLYEPGGLSALGSTLYVADTNHHRIVKVDVKTGHAEVLAVGSR